MGDIVGEILGGIVLILAGGYIVYHAVRVRAMLPWLLRSYPRRSPIGELFERMLMCILGGGFILYGIGLILQRMPGFPR